MAYGNTRFTKTDLFVKSSVADLQDPVFLTFDVDFWPIMEQFPAYDGFHNSALLRLQPGSIPNTDHSDPSTISPYMGNVFGNDPYGTTVNQNSPYRVTEFFAYDWLKTYYGNNYAGLLRNKPDPAEALKKMIIELMDIQDAPWYFQSISGIPDLWKQAHRVKEGNMKTTLTFNCLESIRQPLTLIAENYRWAVYDEERLSYRLPENLRWFDMDIKLIEARNLVDHANTRSIIPIGNSRPGLDLFVRDSEGNVTKGIKITSFKCKMCEFDFSDFLSGGGTQNEFSIVTPEKPFTPSFKVNVGWVIHEEMDDENIELMRQSNLVVGALNAINRRISNTLSSINNLPNSVVGSITNRIQTTIEKAALGNVYNPLSLNGISGAINQFGAALTGRIPPVGPTSAPLTGTKIYPDPQKPGRIGGDEIGDMYPEPPRPTKITRDDLPDIYTQPEPPAQVGIDTLGDAYPEVEAPAQFVPIDVYPEPEPPTPVFGGDLGDIYPEAEQPAPVAGGDLGDSYEDPAPPDPIAGDDLGDIYPVPDAPAPVAGGDLGDSYEDPDPPAPVAGGDLGDIYPEPEQPTPISGGDLGDVYP